MLGLKKFLQEVHLLIKTGWEMKLAIMLRARIAALLPLIFVTSLILLPACECRSFNIWAVWFKRPYTGPMCVVEIVGADLNDKSNSIFDFWSKPDIMVEVKHGKWDRKSHIEGNTFRPRFLWQTKMPYKYGKGFTFTVFDVNVLEGNEVIGRAYLAPDEVKRLRESDGSVVLSIGDGIGVVKVNISDAPKLFTSGEKPLHFLSNTDSQKIL